MVSADLMGLVTMVDEAQESRLGWKIKLLQDLGGGSGVEGGGIP